MNKTDILTDIAVAREHADNTSDRKSMDRLFADVYSDQIGGMDLAVYLRGRFENSAAWGEGLEDLFHALVDDEAASFRPKLEPETKGDMNMFPPAVRHARLVIWGSFFWSGTPQGHSYWEEVVTNLKAFHDEEPRDEDYETFYDMSRVEGIRWAAAELDRAFWWDDTPQGFDYWKDVYHNLIEIADSQ